MDLHKRVAMAVPPGFRDGLEAGFGMAGQQWLDQLPQLLERLCSQWELEIAETTPRHGYLSLIWQVTRQSQSFALKLTMPSEAFDREISGLASWNGDGMVRLIDHDLAIGAALLEWLDASESLEDIPIHDAIEIAARLLSLTPPLAPTSAHIFTNALDDATTGALHWSTRNQSCGGFLSSEMIDAVQRALIRIEQRQQPNALWLVNHDLHYGNVIRNWDGDWVCVDPKPAIGVPEYAIAPLIWRRYQHPTEAVIRLRRLCGIARLDKTVALDWLMVRTVEYLFWALGAGLTDDPKLCRELICYLTESEPIHQ